MLGRVVVGSVLGFCFYHHKHSTVNYLNIANTKNAADLEGASLGYSTEQSSN